MKVNIRSPLSQVNWGDLIYQYSILYSIVLNSHKCPLTWQCLPDTIRSQEIALLFPLLKAWQYIHMRQFSAQYMWASGGDVWDCAPQWFLMNICFMINRYYKILFQFTLELHYKNSYQICRIDICFQCCCEKAFRLGADQPLLPSILRPSIAFNVRTGCQWIWDQVVTAETWLHHQQLNHRCQCDQ